MQFSDKDNKNSDNNFDSIDDNNSNQILDFCKKNIKYIATGIIGVAALVALIISLNKSDQGNEASKETNQQQETENGTEPNEEQPAAESPEQEDESSSDEEAYQVDAVEEINQLLKKYYDLYAKGDTEGISKILSPLFTEEKNTILTVSKYTESFDNIVCYTKKGLDEDSYILSVRYDMKFKDIETKAPGMDFFYIRKTKKGEFFLDNRYSSSNEGSEAVKEDAKVVALLKEFDQQADVIELAGDVQTQYDKAIAADSKLKKMIDETIPTAYQKLVSGETAAEEKAAAEKKEAEEKAAAEKKAAEEKAAEEKKAAQKIKATNDTVYAIDNINIRKEPDENSAKVGSAIVGNSFKRKGTTANGWSQIELNGAMAYIKNDFLSKEKPAVQEEENSGLSYVPEGKEIVVNEALNLRKSMSETSDKVGTVAPGDTIKAILSYEEGWTKVSWKDQVGFIKTEFLLGY